MDKHRLWEIANKADEIKLMANQIDGLAFALDTAVNTEIFAISCFNGAINLLMDMAFKVKMESETLSDELYSFLKGV